MTADKFESSDETKGGTGPGKPLVAHQFPKGRSGKPARRSGARLRGSNEPTRQMILDEAYRPVEMREATPSTPFP